MVKKKQGRPRKNKKVEAQKEENLALKVGKEERQKRLQTRLGDNLDESRDHFQLLRDGFSDKEAMLVCSLEDEMSTDPNRKSSVFDPRLSTIVFERAARVMAQHPKGKAYPTSTNDIGKTKFMNLLLDYYTHSANSWHSMIIKMRIMDLYSMVYGSMFALVPWLVNEKTNYVGPEFIPLPIRGCYPQPTATSINESDWFQVSSMKSLSWIKNQKGKKGWMKIDELIKKVTSGKEEGEIEGDVKEDYQKTFVEKEWYPEQKGDKSFPKIWLQTEYQRNKWHIFAPNYGNLLIRTVDNPFENYELPIVAKNAFPLMDSIIGLGEFERGRTLQLAINSLINLYLDGVKYSIFPPIHIDPNSVVRASIQWGAGAKWLMKNPGRDVKHMRLSPLGLQTFQSTYGFMVSALLNQAGTTAITQPENVQAMMGKTPQALRLSAAKEGARDEWDRVMMEEMIKDVYRKWIQMIVKKQSKKISIRLFGDEARKLAEDHPDVVEFFEEGNYSVGKIGKGQLAQKYDFVLDAGATLKQDPDVERSSLVDVLGMVLKSPNILPIMQSQGKTIDIGEIMKRIIMGGTKDYDKIIKDVPPTGAGMGTQAPPPVEKYKDPDITRTAQAVQALFSRGATPPMK